MTVDLAEGAVRRSIQSSLGDKLKEVAGLVDSLNVEIFMLAERCELAEDSNTALGHRARTAEAQRNMWRQAFNELAEAVETACSFDGGEALPESAPWAAALDALDVALNEIRDAIKRAGA